MHSVAVVIPCRNEAATIGLLLAAIAGQDHAPDEVIVVDDGSTDDTAAAIEAWTAGHPHPPVSVIKSPARGISAALNAGIRASAADVIIRLDGHCRPQPDYIRLSVMTLVDRCAGVAGGVWEIEPGADTSVARAIAAVVSHPIGAGDAMYRAAQHAPGTIVAVDTVPFGCFRRALWERIGGYDEALIANEDFDFNYRVRRAGPPVLLNTGIRSAYRARPTLGALARQYFRYGFWKFRMLRKFPLSLRPRQIPPALILPWVVVTVGAAVVTRAALPAAAALLYPAAVVLGAVHLSAKARAARLLIPSVAAIVTLHLSWSAGFWCGVLPRSPSDT